MSPILLYLLLLAGAAAAVDNEVGYLLEFKKGIQGDPLGNVLTQWDPSSLLNPGSCPGSWPGITCDLDTGSVAGISLDRLGLSGDLKFATLLGLKSLRNLSLAGNAFTGRLVPAMGSMSTLQHLDLAGNNFSGPIPGRISDLWDLRYLNLSQNSFSGWFPAGGPSVSFQNLQQLRFLDLHANNLSGDVSAVLGELVAVEHVDLSGNRFGGGIDGLGPGNVSGLVNTARFVNLSKNRLSGGFWKEDVIGLFRSLEVLDLGSCGVNGELPSFGSLSKLTVLRLGNNSLSGPLSEELVNGSVPLRELDLSSNQFSGQLPSGMFDSVQMISLNLSHNMFNGPIPVKGSATVQLLSLPSSSSSRMVSLDLSYNLLVSNLPSQIGYFVLLRTLNMCNNHLWGNLPAELSELIYLEHLDLSGNRFKGSIPDKLPPSLISLDLSDNDLSGKVPDSLRSKFDISSFRPGNPLLIFPRSPNSVPHQIPSHPPKSRRNVSTPLLVALSVVVCAIIVAFLFSIPLIQRKRSRGMRHLEAGEDAKEGRISNTSFLNSHSDDDGGPSSLSFSNKHLLPSVSRQLSGQPGLTTIEEEIYGGQEIQPEPSGRKSSPGSPVSSSPRFVEVPDCTETLDVHTPDRFGGQLRFLDASLAFTSEDLARAPAEVLGRTCHGTLYKVYLDSGHMLSVKWLRVGLAKEKKRFVKEVKKLGSIRHPNIVPLRAYYWGPREQERLLLTDYVQGDSLALHLHETSPRRYSLLSLSQRLKVAVDVARGLVYLHDRCQLHGNLKPTNILLDGPEYIVRLSDYGHHRLMTPSGVSEQMLNLGALGYLPREFLRNPKRIPPSFKSEVYTFGVILMELLTRRSAGDIISGQIGAVDLTDWVRLCDQEGRRIDCLDKDIAGRDEPPKAMDDLLSISLRCTLPVKQRPTMRQVWKDLSSVSV